MLYYFLFICTFYLGFFKMPNNTPGLIRDVIFLPLVIYSIVSWKKSLKNDTAEKLLIAAWVTFVVYNAFILVSAEKYLSELSSFLNIRDIYPYMLFFIAIVIINDKKKLVKTIKFGLILSVIASLFAIAQSVYGTVPMFDITGFYNIGHWAGQGEMMIGPLARVALPTMYLIYIVFIALIIFDFISGKIKYPVIIVLLFLPILISFTRSFWLASVIAIILTIGLLNKNLLIKKDTFFISFILLVFLSGLILLFMMLDNPVSISLNERLISIFSDIQNTSGTFGYRLMNLHKFIDTWKSFGLFFGVDPFFIGRFNEPTLSDVGFVYVLVTIGVVGLILQVLIWILGIIYAIKTLKTGVRTGNKELSFTGAVLFGSIIFFIICQVYTQFSFASSLFALIFGLSIVSKRIQIAEGTIQ